MRFEISLLFLVFSLSTFGDELIVFSDKAETISKLKDASYVFNKEERRFLVGSGFSDIADAIKVDASLKKDLHKIDVNYHSEDNIKINSLGTEPLGREQWGLYNLGKSFPINIDDINSIEIPGVWGEDIGIYRTDFVQTKKEVIVAVLDTGIDLLHPDLFEQIYTKRDECIALSKFQQCLEDSSAQVCMKKLGKVDSDGNGYPLDCYGWNLTGRVDRTTRIMGDFDVQDKAGHGTHVAGIIAAAKNGIGVRGVAPTVKILPVKILSGAPSGPQMSDVPFPTENTLPQITTFSDIIARGLLYAVRSKADVINMSLGWPQSVDSFFMRRMVELAQSKGIILVAAAGNDSTSATVMPCKYPGVICVASYNPDGSFSHFSNYGSSVDIAAPGFKILSTWPINLRPKVFERNGYEFYDGTSMATPFVAGIVARMIEVGILKDEIYPRLMLGARKNKSSSAFTDLYEKYTLGGNVDLARSLLLRPRPFISLDDETSKSGVMIEWDGVSNKIALSFVLKNYWQDAESVDVAISMNSEGLSLERSSWNESNWESGSKRVFTTEINLANADVGSEHLVTVEIKTDESFVEKQTFEMTIFVPMSKVKNLQRLTIDGDGSNIPTNASLRTVKDLDRSLLTNKYIALYSKSGKDMARLLSRADGRFTVSSEGFLEKVDGTLLEINQLEQNIIFTYKLKPKTKNELPIMEFHLFDVSLNFIKKISYDNKNSVLNENREWVKIGGERKLSWIGNGMLPENERPPFDPWSTTDILQQQLRIYYLDDQLHTISINDGFVPLKFLPATIDQWREGVSPILLAKGEGYDYNFYIGLLKDGRVENITTLDFPSYHMLGGLNPQNLSYSKSVSDNGVFFSDEGPDGSAKISLIEYDKSLQSIRVEQQIFHSLNNMTKVHRIASVSQMDDDSYAFVQSKYELQLHKLGSDEVVFTSIKRFSFMPGLFFDRFFFPVVVTMKEKSVPAMLIPSGLGSSKMTEVIVPQFRDSGELRSLYRPAKMRILPEQNCRELDPVIKSDGTALVFFCGGEFLEIMLK